MTAPDSRDSVERVVAEMREHAADLENAAVQIEASDLADKFAATAVEFRKAAAEETDRADRLQALARGPQQAGGEVASVDALAQLIRAGDGNHRLGAGALAELLWPHYAALQAEVARLREDNALMKANIDSISAAVRSLFGAGSSGDAAIDAALNGGQDDA